MIKATIDLEKIGMGVEHSIFLPKMKHFSMRLFLFA